MLPYERCNGSPLKYSWETSSTAMLINQSPSIDIDTAKIIA
jgi:hypothetical protein